MRGGHHLIVKVKLVHEASIVLIWVFTIFVFFEVSGRLNLFIASIPTAFLVLDILKWLGCVRILLLLVSGRASIPSLHLRSCLFVLLACEHQSFLFLIHLLLLLIVITRVSFY